MHFARRAREYEAAGTAMYTRNYLMNEARRNPLTGDQLRLNRNNRPNGTSGSSLRGRVQER